MNEVFLIKGDTTLSATQPQSTAFYFPKEPKCNLGNAVNPVNNRVCHTAAAKCAKWTWALNKLFHLELASISSVQGTTHSHSLGNVLCTWQSSCWVQALRTFICHPYSLNPCFALRLISLAHPPFSPSSLPALSSRFVSENMTMNSRGQMWASKRRLKSEPWSEPYWC